MHPHSSWVLGVLALSTASLPSFAVEPTSSGAIVVTATRFNETNPEIAANISVITRQDISNAPVQNLPEILHSRAGINVSQLGGVMGRDATVDMRGFGSTASSNTLILVDGLRVNPVDMGSIIWSAIPLESVERIEIVRGSGTVLFGDGATGGVINIITNKSGKPVSTLSATLGSRGYKGTDLHLSNGNDKAYFNLFANTASTDGYRTNSQQDQQGVNGRAGLLLERGEIFTDFAVYKESEGLPGSLFSQAYRDNPKSTRFPNNTEKRYGYRLRPGVTYQPSANVTFETEVGVEHQNLKSNIVSSAYFGDRDRDTLSLTPRLRWRHGLGALPSETVIGADFYDSEVASTNRGAPNQGATQKSSAFYLQNTTRLTTQLGLTTGAREQRVKQSAWQDAYAAWFSPSMSGNSSRSRSAYDIGLKYTEATWGAYAKTGTTFRFANTDELFGYDPVLFVPVFAGDLRPQHGRIDEIGGNLALGQAKLRGSLYRMNLTDEIGYDGSVGANTNLSPTRRTGLEIEIDWKLSRQWLVKASYTHTNARFREGTYSGKAIPLVPRNQSSVDITWDSGERSGRYTASLHHVGERPYGSDFTNSHGMLSGYTTLDLQATWDLKPWKIRAKLLNALDKKYASFAGYSASNNDTYYYPADGRSLLITGQYSF